MNTEDNNKMIAEFMGMKYSDKRSFNDGEWTHSIKSLSRFHTSWDWLMPVVEKIRNVTSYDRDRFSTEVVIYGNKTTIKSGGYGEKKHSKFFFNKTIRGANNTTEATYYAVVEFIKWYNNKNK